MKNKRIRIDSIIGMVVVALSLPAIHEALKSDPITIWTAIAVSITVVVIALLLPMCIIGLLSGVQAVPIFRRDYLLERD